MSNGVNIPSIDPADQDTLTGAFRFIVNKILQDVNGMLPAKIIAFDRATNRVDVLPMIMVVSTGGDQISRAQVTNLPVFQIGGGAAMLSFNLNPGDLGWIIANDRDISLFLQSFEESIPNSNRRNNFSDSLFMPQIMRDFAINEEDLEHATLQNLDGSVRIAIWPDKIKITAPMGLEVDGPITANGGITVTGGPGATFTGNLAVIGNITATGDITPHA